MSTEPVTGLRDDGWDAQRLVPEAPKDSEGGWRGAFARDRARVLHSAAFRRLAAKTQVHADPASGDGFVRTRLTHSLEVAQIAREMGAMLGCDPDVVDTAGLAHDLGHPPFGHNGEDALDEVSQECGGFEGNAQTLRVLTRLEAKILAPDGRPAGLNLTRASLDATCKYPWLRRPGERKYGVYEDDRPVFDWLREGVPDPAPGEGPRRSLEAQVMDWADDVAYSVHDVEDGVIRGHVRLSLPMDDVDERAQLCRDVAEAYSSLTPDELAEVLEELFAEPALRAVARFSPAHGSAYPGSTDPYGPDRPVFEGSAAALAALKYAASLLIGRFATAAVRATRERYGPGPLRRYDADLIVPRRIRAQCALLKGIALRYVMRRPGSEERYARERQVLRDLVAVLAERAPEVLDPVFAHVYRRAEDDAARLRVVIDQVASLTDQTALAWYARLVK